MKELYLPVVDETVQSVEHQPNLATRPKRELVGGVRGLHIVELARQETPEGDQ